MARWAQRLGPLGYTLMTLTLMVGAVLAQEWRGMGVLAATLALTALLRPAAFAVFRSWRVGLGALSVLLAATFLGSAQTGAPTDVPAYLLGIWMLARGLTIVLVVNFYVRSVSLGDLALMLERLGIQGLGFALGVALNMLPVLLDSAGNTLAALRMRGGFRRRPWQTLRWLLVTILVNGLRRGDEITAAAEARGYDPARLPVIKLRVGPGDLAWEMVTLLSVGAALWLP